MVLQTLGKFATKAMKVANNKAESLLNKGIERLDAMDPGAAPEEVPAEAKRAEVIALTAEISSNTDLVVLLTKGDRSERITFRKGGKSHERVLKAIVEEVLQTGESL